MTRNEFIDGLQKTLAGSLSSSTVNENVRYYQDYIDMHVRSGQSEEQVIAELGDPRLLAKSITEAAKQEGRGRTHECDEVYEDGYEGEGVNGQKGGNSHLPIWGVILITVLILFALIGIVGSVLRVFLPIIIPAACVLFLVRFFKNRS